MRTESEEFKKILNATQPLSELVNCKSNMSLHRFYLPPESCLEDRLRLEGREAHHALHVLRLKHGDRVGVLDGAGGQFLCDVEYPAKAAVTLAVKEKTHTPAPPCPVSLFVAVPKGKIIEDVIEKAVELGARRIVPLLTSVSSRTSTPTTPRPSARNGSRSPSRPSSNAAPRGCRASRRRWL